VHPKHEEEIHEDEQAWKHGWCGLEALGFMVRMDKMVCSQGRVAREDHMECSSLDVRDKCAQAIWQHNYTNLKVNL